MHVNEVQGNPFQPDVNFRGYTASPLLGTLRACRYMDGVRLNQPFGDVVSWDLIPRGAIASITLIPGSNPLFGLNTLGGALSIQTKDGLTAPGTSLMASYGRFARRTGELQHGGSNTNGLDWYFLGNYTREHGWRDESPSRLGQLFSKLGWHDSSTAVDSVSRTPIRSFMATAFRISGYSSATTRASTRSRTSPRTRRTS